MPLEFVSSHENFPVDRSGRRRDDAPRPGSRWGRHTLNAKERMFLVERLSVLLSTGTSLHQGLQTLAAHASSGPARRLLEALEGEVAGGRSFSDALRQHPGVFPETYIGLIDAAERGGFVPEILERIYQSEEKRQELRSTLLASITYPAFLVLFSISVVVFVLVVVFPKFGDLFELIANELPTTTVWLMAMSELLRTRWWILLSGAVASVLFGLRWLRRGGVETLDRWAYKLPLVNRFFAELHLIQFLGLMSLSLANGVDLLQALRACRASVSSPRFRGFVDALDRDVNEGRGIAAGFLEATFLPPLAGQMIATGEESGSLGSVMARVAHYYERQWRKRLEAATKLIEPLMLLVMGVVIGLIVSSLLLPIFKLSRAVR